MAYLVRMPQLNLEMVEGTLIEWFVSEGEAVGAEEDLLQIETDKTVQDIQAREEGVLHRRIVEEGETVDAGTPLGIVAKEDADISALEREATNEGAPLSNDAQDQDSDVDPEIEAGGDQQGIRVSPRARQYASERGVDLGEVEASDGDEPITEADVEAAADAGKSDPIIRQIDGMRGTIADRLQQSYQEAVHVTIERTINADDLVDTARSIETDGQTGSLSFIDLLLSDLSYAFTEHPEFNGFVKADQHELVPEHRIAVAVDVDDGLVTPVLPDIRDLPADKIAQERRELTNKAKAGNLSSEDLQGGTFTVSNLGVHGVESFDPIINPPQVAIVGVNALDEQPSAVVDDELTFEGVLPLNLTFDHRVVDGADAARFLETLAERLETPRPARYLD